MTRRDVGRGAPVVVSALITACGPAGQSAGTFATRDSAGIQLTTAYESSPNLWRVSAEPVLRVGTADGPPASQLFRVGGILRLTDGSIAIGNAGTGEIRIYDSTGGFLHALGRPGNGPGEFTQATSIPLWRGPEGSLVTEAHLNRINIFESSGTLRGAVRLDGRPVATLVAAMGVFAGGDILAYTQQGPAQAPAGTVVSRPAWYLRFDPSGQLQRTLVEFQSRPTIAWESDGRITFPYLPFTADRLVATAGDAMVMIRGSPAELEVRDGAGAVTALIRWVPPARRVRDIWDRHVDEFLARIPEPAARARNAAFLNQTLPLPEFLPAASQLLTDTDGHFWVERYRLPWDPVSIWDILAPDGTWVATLDIPPAGILRDIGEDYILGVWRDEDGIEQVRMYGLRRGG